METASRSGPYRTVEEIRAANAAAGQHWFEPATMRFFSSRVGRTVYGGRYFITSETPGRGVARRYSIREALPDGTVSTVGEFQAYATRNRAEAAVLRLVAELGD